MKVELQLSSRNGSGILGKGICGVWSMYIIHLNEDSLQVSIVKSNTKQIDYEQVTLSKN